MTTLLARIAVLGLLGVLSTGCVSRGFPTHGGGKRFSREQQALSTAIDAAVAEIDFELLPEEVRTSLNEGVGLLVFSVADSGGGVRSGGGGGLDLFGLFGGGSVSSGSVAATVRPPAPTGYASYGSTSSEDLEYLKGRIVHRILEEKIRFNPVDSEAGLESGMIIVTVGEFGIDESSFNALIVSSNRLKSRVQLNAYFVRQVEGAGTEPEVHPLCASRDKGVTFESLYEEWYLLGLGPVNTPSVLPVPVNRDA